MRIVLFLSALALLTAGCSNEPKLALQPMTGTVVVQGGGSLAGGKIEFIPADTVHGTAIADIAVDGSYTIQTLTRGQKKPGIAPGSYQVIVHPPSKGERTFDPIAIDGRIEVKEGEKLLPPLTVPWERK